jgi:DNA-binding response OmpR family regulator
LNILVAEDEADIRSLLQLALTDDGHRVFAASDGAKALALFQAEEIHLAILDVMMPRLDGLNLLRKLREKSTVPVIFLTARSGDADKVLGLGLGADDYLSKPFSTDELLARVNALLRRNYEYMSACRQPRILEYGGLRLNMDSCTVTRDGAPVELGAKEYLLLKYLMENRERVFTKKQLYNAVWDDDYYYDDNTVMVHISRIRNKLEADPQNPAYIKTIRGIGYKLHKTDALR